MKRVAIVALLVAGCAPTAPVPGLPSGKCETKGLGDLIARQATPGLVDRARQRAGASVARVLRPGQVVTMEYRDGRLDVTVDGRNRVTSFGCG